MKFSKTIVLALTLIASQAVAQTPVCSLPGSDADGDGWGWENGKSCRVVVAGTVPGSVPGTGAESQCSTLAKDILARMEAGGLSAFSVKDLINDIAALPYLCAAQ